MRASKGETILACAAGLIVGGFVSLFTAGPALFADGPFASRPPVVAYSVVAFVITGLAMGFLAPGAWKPAAICLALSGLPVVLFFGRTVLGQPPMMVLAVGFALGDAAAGAFGVWAGMRLRTARSARRAGHVVANSSAAG
jgi:hypothetical protein